MDNNFNGDVVSTTNIMLPIKLYLCLIISNMSVASSDDNKTFDLIYKKIFSLPRVVPCFPLLGLTPIGLFMV